MFANLIEIILSNCLYFALHLEKNGAFPKPLSAKEERECFSRMAEGDDSARTKLIEHNLRLVAHIVKKYYSNSSDQEDLISIGTIGLIKAVSTFDHTKGTRFATYGSKCVENEILMHFRSLKKSAGELYFDEPIDTDKDGNQLTLMDIISEDIEIIDKIDLSIKSGKLYTFLPECLDDRVVVMDKGKILTLGTPREVFSQVELLKKHRLDVPQATELAYKLKGCGLNIDKMPLNEEECVKMLEEVLK